MFGTVEMGRKIFFFFFFFFYKMGGKILNTREGKEMMWVTIFTLCGVKLSIWCDI